MVCPICNGNQCSLVCNVSNIHGRRVLSDERFALYQCDSCGVSSINVVLNENYYRTYYEGNYYVHSNNIFVRFIEDISRDLSYRWHKSIIDIFKHDATMVLEVGCGTGDFLRRLPLKYTKVGVEISRQACVVIRKKYPQITINENRIGEGFYNHYKGICDCIVMWHVFEHIDNPEEFLSEIVGLLTENGRLVIEIPNIQSLGFRLTGSSWFHLDAPRHLFLYNRSALQRLIKVHGLQIRSYFSNPVDYCHDLAASIYSLCMGKFRFAGWVIGLFLAPWFVMIRFMVSICAPQIAETNTYIIERSRKA